MTIRLYKTYTPGTRNRSVSGFEEIVRSNPQKKLTYGQHNKRGRNNRGVITSRHRGGVSNSGSSVAKIPTKKQNKNTKDRVMLTSRED
ncbi:hypothetical protein CY35_04G040300 [Sphagnum magellanicum]|nr:hypothetical protein CY35_04G040300 [Sphagnum magellanicum]